MLEWSLVKLFMNLFHDFLSSDKKPWERNSLKGPGLRARSLKNSPEVFSAFWLLRPKGFIPSQSHITPRLPNGGAYVFATFLPSIGTGARVSLWYSLAHRPMGLRTEVILWERVRFQFKRLPQDHLCRIGSQTQFVTHCLVNNFVPKHQKQKPPCRATSTGSGG